MSLFLNQREESSRYKVSVVDPNDKKVDSITTPASKGSKVYHNIVRKVVNVAMTLMLAFLGLFAVIGTAAPANANFIDDGFKSAFCSTGLFNYELETRMYGPTTGNDRSARPTPYEKYGTAGLEWTVWLGAEDPDGLNEEGEFGGASISSFTKQGVNHIDDEIDGEEWKKYPGFYNVDKTCVPVMDVGATAIANFIMTGTAELIQITNLVYQVAYESSANILSSIEDPLKTIVTTMRDAVFFEFLTPIIMLSALWMAWTGLVKRSSTQAAQGAGWMILAAVASVALMSNPMWLPKVVNNVVSSVSEAGMTAVTSTTTNGAGEICTVADQGDPGDTLTIGKSNKYIEPSNEKARKVVRQMQCTMWYSFLYTPWVMGQFGDSPSEIDENHIAMKGFRDGTPTVGGQTPVGGTGIGLVKFGTAGVPAPAAAQNWALYHLDNKIALPGMTAEEKQQQQNSLISVALTQLHHEDYNKAYRGDDSMNRVATATIGLVAALGAGIMIVIVSMSIIILDVGLIILTLVSPLFFLVGVHPGFGRRIALGWLETILGLALKRIVLSMLLSVMLVFYATILSANASMPWMFSMILVIAVSIGGISYKDQILNMFNKINLGGDGGVQPQHMPGADRAKHAGANMVKSAARMAVAGKIMGAANNRGGTAGPGDGSGAGKRKAPTDTVRDRAAAEVAKERAAGAGARPVESDNKRKGGEADTAANSTAGIGGGAGNRVEPNGTKGVAGGNTAESVDMDRDASSGAGTRINGEEAEATQLGGAGHYTGPDGRIVDADGVPVPLEKLSAEERELMENDGAGNRVENVNAGAAIDDGMSPSAAAIARIKHDSPQEIKKRAEAEAKRITDRDRLIPPMRPTASQQAAAIQQNKAFDANKKRSAADAVKDKKHAAAVAHKQNKNIENEKLRLQAKNGGKAVTTAEARKSIQIKERAAEVARLKRNGHMKMVVQKKRELVNEPLREIRTMANAADDTFAKGYVKKTIALPGRTTVATGRGIVKAGAATGRGIAKASVATVNAADQKIENLASRRLYEAEVQAKVWEIRGRDRQEQRELKKSQAGIPKRYRTTETQSQQQQQPQRRVAPQQPPRRIEPPQ